MVVEGDVFLDSEEARSTPEGIPYRDIENVLITKYDQVVNIVHISKFGPLQATAVCSSGNSCRKQSTFHLKVLDIKDSRLVGKTFTIYPVLEYSLEYPYGEDAIIWIKSEQAFYRIISFHPAYQAIIKDFQEAANICGHLINTLLNVRSDASSPFIVTKVSRYSGLDREEVLKRLWKYRNFILRQLKAQPKKVSRLELVEFLQGEVKTWRILEERVLKYNRKIKSNSDEDDDSRPPRESPPISDKPTLLEKNKSPKHGSSLEEPSAPNPITVKKKSLPISIEVISSSDDEAEMQPVASISADVFSLKKVEDERPSQPIPKRNKCNPSSTMTTITTPQMAKRSIYVPLLTPSIVGLPLPSLGDASFQCPFCPLAIINWEGSSKNIIEKVRDHVASTHQGSEASYLRPLYVSTEPSIALELASSRGLTSFHVDPFKAISSTPIPSTKEGELPLSWDSLQTLRATEDTPAPLMSPKIKAVRFELSTGRGRKIPPEQMSQFSSPPQTNPISPAAQPFTNINDLPRFQKAKPKPISPKTGHTNSPQKAIPQSLKKEISLGPNVEKTETAISRYPSTYIISDTYGEPLRMQSEPPSRTSEGVSPPTKPTDRWYRFPVDLEMNSVNSMPRCGLCGQRFIDSSPDRDRAEVRCIRCRNATMINKS